MKKLYTQDSLKVALKILSWKTWCLGILNLQQIMRDK